MADALGDGEAVTFARAASPMAPEAAACSNWRAGSASTSSVTAVVPAPVTDSVAGATPSTWMSSPTSAVYGRAPAYVAYASTRSAELSRAGTDATRTVTATSPVASNGPKPL